MLLRQSDALVRFALVELFCLIGLATPAAAQTCTYSIRNTAIDDIQLNRTLRSTGGVNALPMERRIVETVGLEAALASDRSKGLFLIAVPERQTSAKRRFQCEISLQ